MSPTPEGQSEASSMKSTPKVTWGAGVRSTANVEDVASLEAGNLEMGSVRNVATYDNVSQMEAQVEVRHFGLGWKRLTVVLIVEAVALGSLSIPSAFAALGMVAGITTTVVMGLIAVYTAMIVGQVKLAFPSVAHYADAGRLLMGTFGYELIGAMFSILLIFLVGSHCLTGTVALLKLFESGTCSLVFGVVSAVILFLLSTPPSFVEVAILGYVDFVSIMLAIGLTVVATGLAHSKESGASTTAAWSAWPREDLSFADGFNAICQIVFAYAFSVCQFSFMDEMHAPQDFAKSIWVLGVVEIVIYTLTGALIYVFVGADVASPALLSAGPHVAKWAFLIALPVIFISGAINGTVVARYLHGRLFGKEASMPTFKSKKGWGAWLLLLAVITVTGWVIAEAIPFFSDLLSICSALFVSGFTFYFPAMMWFMLLKKGKWYAKENLLLSMINAVVFIMGIVVLVAGTYSAVADIKAQYAAGKVRGAFSCAPM